MQAGVNKVVKFHYKLSEAEGPVFESSYESEPMVYLHGFGGVIPGLEEAIEGKSAGETFDAVVPAEKGYGEPKKDAVKRVSVKHVIVEGKSKPKLKPGMLVHLNTEQGPTMVTVLKVGLKNIDVNTNHPLAGRTLKFDVEILDVREATEEEIEHGHVHGDGGVHH